MFKKFWFGAVLMLLLSAVPGYAQQLTGQIRGLITDPTGAYLDVDRNQVVRRVHSNDGGEYVAPQLPVGTYTVTIEAAGFKKLVKSGVILNVNDSLQVNAALTVGKADEVVSVQAEASQVNLSNSAVEGLITGKQIRELPLNNRNYEQLITLQPGVTSNAADQIYVGTTNPSGQVNIVSFSVNGNRQSQNNWTVDGADNVDHGSNITLLVYPSVDAISEFKIERSNYGAEFGRSASGQINVVTRSGTSQFHGGAYEFFRNDALNAVNSYTKHTGGKKAVLRYNDFGGTIGGPIYKDKTFFFFSEELRRVTTPVTQTATLPSVGELSGNFAVPVCTAIDSAGNCTATGTTISNINPIAAAYIKDIFSKIPAPDATGTLVSNSSGVFNYQESLVRLDHTFNSRWTVMGRYIHDGIPTKEPYGLFGPQTSIPGVASTSTDSPGQQIMGRINTQISNSVFNELGYAYSYGAITSDTTGLLARSNSPDIAQATNLPYKVTLHRVPNVGFADISGIAGFGEYRDFNYNHNVFDNVSYVLGKHSLRFGVTYNHYLKSENAAGDNVGNYNFDSTNAVGSDDLSLQSQDWANFLIGYASDSFSQAPIDITANTTQNLYEFYGQDEWRASPRLTVNFGLRYSYFQTPFDTGHKLTSFDPSVYKASDAPQIDPQTGQIIPGTGVANNGIIIGGVNSPYGRYITKQAKNNLAPRLGGAYDVFGDGMTSLRAGAGIFFDSVAAGLAEDNSFNNPPYVSGANFGSIKDIGTVGSLTALSNNLPPSLWSTAPNWKTPYAAEWNLDVQHQVKQAHNMILDIGYVGNKGTHLVGVQDINQVLPGAAVASGLYANPYAGGTGAGERLNAVRPYLGYGSIGQVAPQFDSNYNSFQLSVEQPLAANLTANAAYTYSHGLTDNQSDRSTGLQNTYCRRCEYGSSSIDRRHVFTGNFIYQLPFFHDQVGFAGHLLGGIQATGIITVNSGLPLTVLASRNGTFGDPAASGLNVDGSPNNGRPSNPRPNIVGNPNNGPKSWGKFFNTAAFAAPTGPQKFGGTESRGAVIGPGLWRYDMAVSKETRIVGRLSMQLRAEAFNLFNHTNFATVSTSMTSSLYGRVTSTRDPRTLQVSAKFIF
jgi:hypothetical protein